MKLAKFIFAFICCLTISYMGFSADYYWVGNSGNWGDINHWVTTSGGAISQNQIPTANDKIIFDENSFTTPGAVVTLNTENIFVDDMDWSNAQFNPSLQASELVVLNVFGSLILNANMNWNFLGNLQFLSNTDANRIDLAGHIACNNLLFDGNGSWVLLNPLQINHTFSFNKGQLNTNGQAIDCQYFHLKSEAPRTLMLGGTQLTISGISEGPILESIPSAIFNLNNLVLNAGTSNINFTASRVHIAYQGTGTLRFNQVILSSTIGNSDVTTDDLVEAIGYTSLELLHSTKIDGNNSIEALQLAPGKSYVFASGATNNFNQIDAIGDCIEPIGISASLSGSAANFSSTSPNIQLDYVVLRDIHISAGNNFTLNNGIDLGNNLGWTINPKTAADLYWVGGTGNWDDPMHWATSSGGPGGGCVPTAVDNVFFDDQSFGTTGQSVNINLENAYCQNMDWTAAIGSPSLIGDISNGLRINGSLRFIENMQLDFDGIVYFESNQPTNTLFSAGQQFKNDIHFQGILGSWQLLDPLIVEEAIYLNSGTLNTNGQTVELGSFYSENAHTRTLLLGNSHILLETTESEGTIWSINTENLILNAGTSLIEGLDRTTNFWNKGPQPVDYHQLIFNATCDMRNDIAGTVPIRAQSTEFRKFGQGLGNIHFDTLRLTASYAYQFEDKADTKINHLIANGNCDGMIFLNSKAVGKTASIDLDSDHSFESLYLKDIQQIGAGELVANNSTDGGGVIGWTINSATPRSLFWVGGTGNWSDPQHWSLTSGGLGGECIPTPIDNVTFDENATNSNSFAITTFEFDRMFCHDFTQRNLPNIAEFRLGYINVFGSLNLQADLLSELGFNLFSNEVETLQSNNARISFLNIRGDGEFGLLDPLQLSNYFIQWDGSFQSNGFDIAARGMDFRGKDNDLDIDISNSYVLLFDERQIFTATLDLTNPNDQTIFSAENSTIELSHPNARVYAQGNVAFHNVFFSNPAGKVDLISDNDSRFSKLSFRGNALINGAVVTDSLFFAMGKSYTLSIDGTKKINQYFQALGHNCGIIEIKSSQSGQKSTMQVLPDTEVVADFIQMQDQTGIGGNNLLAGAHSTDIGNSNSGWIFESAPELTAVSFLGKDRVICPEETIVLNANNFSLDESYNWQDNSTDSIFVADEAGLYFVQIIFNSNNCLISDSIELFDRSDFVGSLPADTSLCEGEQLILTAPSTLNVTSYLWQDGSQNENFLVESAGIYSLSKTIDNCLYTDSILINYLPAPEIALSASDSSFCEGDFTTLSADVSDNAASLLWNTGETTDDISVDGGGVFWLEAVLANCTARDSLIIEAKSCNYFQAYLPNAFSPNGDGENDYFAPHFEPNTEILSYEFNIFDRWGNQVFNTQDPLKAWDGQLKGQYLEAGVFIYFIKIQYRDDRGEGQELLRGDVVIFR